MTTNNETKVLHATDASFVKDIAEWISIVDFWAEWCGPCRVMIPRLDELAVKMGNTAKVMKMNVDEEPETARNFRVMSIPTMIIFKDWKPVKQLVWIQEVSVLENELKSLINN